MGCGKESETWRAKAAELGAELGAVEGRRAASIAQVSLTPACLTSVSATTASSDKCQSGHCQCGSASSDKCQFDLVSSLTWSVVCRAPPHQHRADSRRGALGQTRQGVCTSTERCAHQPQSFEADGTEARDTVKSRHVLFTNFTTPNRPASRQTVDHTHTSTERLTQCWLPAV